MPALIESTTEMPVHQQNFVAKLSELPLVSSVVTKANELYSNAKGSNETVEKALTTVESSVAAISAPLVEKVESNESLKEKLKYLDEAACEKLAIVEDKYPIIKESPEVILENGKRYVDENKTYIQSMVQSKVDYSLKVKGDLYTETLNRIEASKSASAETFNGLKQKSADMVKYAQENLDSHSAVLREQLEQQKAAASGRYNEVCKQVTAKYDEMKDTETAKKTVVAYGNVVKSVEDAIKVLECQKGTMEKRVVELKERAMDIYASVLAEEGTEGEEAYITNARKLLALAKDSMAALEVSRQNSMEKLTQSVASAEEYVQQAKEYALEKKTEGVEYIQPYAMEAKNKGEEYKQAFVATVSPYFEQGSEKLASVKVTISEAVLPVVQNAQEKVAEYKYTVETQVVPVIYEYKATVESKMTPYIEQAIAATMPYIEMAKKSAGEYQVIVLAKVAPYVESAEQFKGVAVERVESAKNVAVTKVEDVKVKAEQYKEETLSKVLAAAEQYKVAAVARVESAKLNVTVYADQARVIASKYYTFSPVAQQA
eukprot:Nk52_evm20s1444 gene=Nk52_evmTU20s1444